MAQTKKSEIPIAWTREEDARTMIDFYERHPELSERFNNYPARGVVRSIEQRVYTEWCANPKENPTNDYLSYHGQAFDKWIADEIYYALERTGFTVDCADTRRRVLEAGVRRAVGLFSEWDCKTAPPHDKTGIASGRQEPALFFGALSG